MTKIELWEEVGLNKLAGKIDNTFGRDIVKRVERYLRAGTSEDSISRISYDIIFTIWADLEEYQR